jgi:hypothetical protein
LPENQPSTSGNVRRDSIGREYVVVTIVAVKDYQLLQIHPSRFWGGMHREALLALCRPVSVPHRSINRYLAARNAVSPRPAQL